MSIISPTLDNKRVGNVFYDNTVCQRALWWRFFLCSQHILNKRTISHTGTISLFQVSFTSNFIVCYNCNAK